MRTRLVERARDGDDVAFAELVDLDGDLCYAIAYRILRDAERAQDAVQQAFLLAWRELPRLRDPETLRTMAPSAPRQCLLRGAAPTSALEHPDQGHAGRRTERTRPHGLGRRPGRPRPRVRALTPEHRAVFVLHHHAGHPLAEIADIVGIPVGTVKSRLHYATRTLRAAIVADSQVESHGGTTGMNAPRDPDSIVSAWLEEGPTRLPDQTRRSITVALPTTSQQRRALRVPWRFPTMSTIPKLAVGAVVVIAVLLGGAFLLRPGPSDTGVGGAPIVSPSPSPAPSAARRPRHRRQRPTPTASPLRARSAGLPFTSSSLRVHASRYPPTWVARQATRTVWAVASRSDLAAQRRAAIYDVFARVRPRIGPGRPSLASRPTSRPGTSEDAWLTCL